MDGLGVSCLHLNYHLRKNIDREEQVEMSTLVTHGKDRQRAQGQITLHKTKSQVNLNLCKKKKTEVGVQTG